MWCCCCQVAFTTERYGRLDVLINVAGVDIMRQCLDLGALQEIRVDVAAVLLHNGVRHLDGLQRRDISLAQIEIVEGAGVTHIRYAVSYGDIEEKSS